MHIIKLSKYIFKKEDVQPFKGMCGMVYELINPKNTLVKNVNLTLVTVNPKREAEKHYHKITEELYYILEGNGYVEIGEECFEIKKGDAIFVPPKVFHKLINKSNVPLKVLVIDSPPYSPDDTFIIEKNSRGE